MYLEEIKGQKMQKEDVEEKQHDLQWRIGYVSRRLQIPSRFPMFSILVISVSVVSNEEQKEKLTRESIIKSIQT